MSWFTDWRASKDMEGTEVKCTCQDCGKTFNKGDEGDNEKFCLRCEHIALSEGEDYE